MGGGGEHGVMGYSHRLLLEHLWIVYGDKVCLFCVHTLSALRESHFCHYLT